MFTLKSAPLSSILSRTPLKNVLLRSQSTQSKELVLVNVDDKSGFSIVTLNSPPVNSLNLEVLTALSSSLDELKKNNTRGMILTSVSN
jgi:Delta3-Delta2-enoyl-CoA isomerase